MTPSDHTAIAQEVARLLRQQESTNLDAKYLASLPLPELKRVLKERMREDK